MARTFSSVAATPDYGGQNAAFEVATVEPPSVLVYRSVRGRVSMTWSITLIPRPAPGSPAGEYTRVHLRLRLAPARRKWLADTAGGGIVFPSNRRGGRRVVKKRKGRGPQMARQYGRRVHRLPDHRRDGRRAQRTRRAVTPSGGSLTADGPERARRGELDAEDGLAARARHGLAAGRPDLDIGRAQIGMYGPQVRRAIHVSRLVVHGQIGVAEQKPRTGARPDVPELHDVDRLGRGQIRER